MILIKPIDKAILIYFRFITGILMSQELINKIIIGKFEAYSPSKVHFTYTFFDWIRPWTHERMVLHYGITILAGYAMALGWKYRFSSIVLFLGWTSLFLMDQTDFINHTYLYSLVSFWMIFLPLKNDHQKTAPAWTLYLILFHMSLAYFFGGIAKINYDWLQGTPMDIFLLQRKNYPLGFIYSQSWAPIFFSYGGILFDLLIVPLMLIPQTRKFGLFISIIFHFSNVLMFGLATFPWFSLLLTTMFFDPSWPRKIPFFKNYLGETPQKEEAHEFSPVLAGLISLYVLIQLALPFRHFLYPGNASWTEEGHMFAWRMMLRHKQGRVQFYVKTNQKLFMVDKQKFINPRKLNDLMGNPDMILQFAHFLRDYYKKELGLDVEVYASSFVSLNGRKHQQLIKPGTNLALKERRLGHYKWIMPLKTERPAFLRAPLKI